MNEKVNKYIKFNNWFESTSDFFTNLWSSLNSNKAFIDLLKVISTIILIYFTQIIAIYETKELFNNTIDFQDIFSYFVLIFILFWIFATIILGYILSPNHSVSILIFIVVYLLRVLYLNFEELNLYSEIIIFISSSLSLTLSGYRRKRK
jgi:hypothetical protein